MARPAAPAAGSTSSFWSPVRRIGTNPEQPLAAGWSACFESSIGISALKRKMPRPEVEIDAEVDLNLANGEYFISARFSVSLPGLDRDIAKSLIQDAE
jgi:organic hydroperoxide reductase OsmC/OhrA